MIYLKSRLRGKAYNAVIYGFGKDGSISFKSISAIMALLKQSFGNTDEEGTAQTDIMKLKQLHKLTIEFLNDWSQKAQLTGFDNKSKIALLKNVLHPELLICLQHLQLSQFPISSNFPGFLAQLCQIDSIICQTNPNYTNKPTAATPQVLPVSFIPHQAPQDNTTTQSGDEMDLSGITIHAVWVNKQGNKIPQNDEERAQRKTFCFANSLCN
ncbi:hypothetical protein LPUS_03426 [Lasallia pustulata]|uniref:Uncharacterized protein n=1 Tax=Lasallia pustulata TaxID=136370 RepID=A0A1W5CV87_9LECA|nr:hypothetical protein LPUS_03426 [Lasallia pustulata]